MTIINSAASESSLASLSVVIATLGGDSLKRTIESLNSGTIVPDEIVICIPMNEASRAEKFHAPNLKILKTTVRGQVAQRAAGFANVKNSFVMQLDDDMIVHYRCIEHLLCNVQLEKRMAVAPVLVDFETGLSAYRTPPKNAYFSSLYYWMQNGAAGYQPGSVYLSGTPEGVDPWSQDQSLIEVQWLAGGCVMHRRENLILENFYPFSGKAFYEDIIHSYHLRSNDIRLAIDPKAICSLELTPLTNLSPKEFIGSLISEFKVKKYYFQISSQHSYRIYFFYVFYAFNYFYKRFCKKLHEVFLF